MSRPKPVIIDLSEHQVPQKIDYWKLAQAIDLVIVRVQSGSLHEDKYYQTHLERLRNYQVPINVYAWVRGISEADMEQEATDFYQRAKAYQPAFWWLDIEEQSMSEMVSGTEVFRQKLKALGARKVGAYIGNHLYGQFGFTDRACRMYDGIWLPTYGQNTGNYDGYNPTATAAYDLHQYTSNGRLPGYAGSLDVSRIASEKPLGYFTHGTSEVSKTAPGYQLGELVNISGIYSSSSSMTELIPLRRQGRITKIIEGAPNPYLLDGGQLGWVNEGSIMDTASTRRYIVKQGDTLWGIGRQLGIDWENLAKINQLANPNLIYPGQQLVY